MVSAQYQSHTIFETSNKNHAVDNIDGKWRK